MAHRELYGNVAIPKELDQHPHTVGGAVDTSIKNCFVAIKRGTLHNYVIAWLEPREDLASRKIEPLQLLVDSNEQFCWYGCRYTTKRDNIDDEGQVAKEGYTKALEVDPYKR